MDDVVRVKNFHKTFGGKVVHKGVNLSIKEGEILTLMGGSGSGKSVLLRALIGLERPDKGTIHFHNKEITGLGEEQLVGIRKKIAYVFQNGALFDSLTVKDNLAYPLREHTKMSEEAIHEKVVKSLERVGMEESIDLFPSDLSGGMQRRIGVARAIIMDPEVILYDEPTTGLDPYNTRLILRIVKQNQKMGATSVLVTHDMSSLFAVTDRVAFLRQGKIAAIGSAREMRHSKNDAVQGFIHGKTP